MTGKIGTATFKGEQFHLELTDGYYISRPQWGEVCNWLDLHGYPRGPVIDMDIIVTKAALESLGVPMNMLRYL